MKVISDWIAKEHEKFKLLTPHTLRHTFTTRCIERGMNPKTVQVILGHSSVNITMNLYCHVTEDTLISEMSKFEAEESEKVVNRQSGVISKNQFNKSLFFKEKNPTINISETKLKNFINIGRVLLNH